MKVDFLGYDVAVRIEDTQTSDDGIGDRKVCLGENGTVLLEGTVDLGLIGTGCFSALSNCAADSEEGLFFLRGGLEAIS